VGLAPQLERLAAREGAGVDVSDTARIERAVELLSEAQVRLPSSTREVYILVDLAITKLRDELADRMLEDASAEIMGLVDIHGLIDEVGGGDRAVGFE
jgi:hypothetical protein